MATTPGSSALDQYMSQYGQKLQSLLIQPTNPAPVMGAAPAPGAQPAAQPSALAPQAPNPQERRLQHVNTPLQPQQPQGEGAYSFRDLWRDVPEQEKSKAIGDLEANLKRGGQTIDDAYDAMIEKLGAPPEADQPLSRDEKAMLIMEFGLSLMAASGPRGQDLGAAIGTAGLSTMRGHQERQERKRQQRDAHTAAVSALELERTRAKSKLGEQSALEGMRASREEAEAQRRADREQAEGGRIAGTVTAEDGSVFGYTRGGEVRPFTDPTTDQPIRAREPYGRGPGSRGGAARDGRTANQKNIDDLIARGLPEDLAVRIVYRQIKDPRQAWQAIYRDRVRQYASQQEAAAEADDIVKYIYGPNAMQQTREPIVPDDNDPLGIRSQLGN